MNWLLKSAAPTTEETTPTPTPDATSTPAFKSWFSGSKVVDGEGHPLRCYHGTKSSIDFEEFSVDGPVADESDDEGVTSTGSGADVTAFMGAHFAQETSVANQFAQGSGWMKARYDGQDERPRVIPVYLSIKSPKDFGAERNLRNYAYQGEITGYEDELLKRAMEADGIDSEDEESEEVEAWFQDYNSDPAFRVEAHTYLFESYRPQEGEDNELNNAASDLGRQAVSRLKGEGHDGIKYKNQVEGGISWIVFEPNQVKSAFASGFDPNDRRFTASKTADEGSYQSWEQVKNGESATLYVYRGGGGGHALEPRYQRELGREYLLGDGLYFARSENMASNWGSPKLYRVSLKNPYVLSGVNFGDVRKLDLDAIKAAGHDGIIIKSGRYGFGTGQEDLAQGIVFKPNSENVQEADQIPEPTTLTKGAIVKIKQPVSEGYLRQCPELKDHLDETHKVVGVGRGGHLELRIGKKRIAFRPDEVELVRPAKVAAMDPSIFAPHILVDLDGTIAQSIDDYSDPTLIGLPIDAMVEKIQLALRHGERIVVFTARMADKENAAIIREAIGDYTEKYIGTRLDATCIKTPGAREIWDDKARQVIENTGEMVRVASAEYPVAGPVVDGLTVGKKIDNQDSISASLTDYEILKGVRVVPMKGLHSKPTDLYYAADDIRRCERLAETIRVSGRIDPLIVVVDAKGPYILEGGHRLGALHILKKDAFPALVVQDLDDVAERPGDGVILASGKKAKEQEIDGAKYNEDGYWAGDGNAASGVLPIARDTKRICLAWRNVETHTGNCWGTIGGAVKDGYTPAESARAEMEEEVGYSGSIDLQAGWVFQDKSFKYHNFVGVVDGEFPFKPVSKHAWETDEITWFTLAEIDADMEANPGDFHPELINFFKHSRALIERLAGDDAPEPKKAKISKAAALNKNPPAKPDANYLEGSNGWALYPDQRDGAYVPAPVEAMAETHIDQEDVPTPEENWVKMGGSSPKSSQHRRVRHMAAEETGQLPPEPGTAPIPAGTIRLFHYTNNEANLEGIQQQGLLKSKARGDDNSGSGPSAGVWASTKLPSEDNLRNNFYIEFWVTPEEISRNGEYPPRGKDPVAWAGDGEHHVILQGDLKPNQLVAVHLPWQRTAHYLLESNVAKTDPYILEDKEIADLEQMGAVNEVKAIRWYKQHTSGEGQ